MSSDLIDINSEDENYYVDRLDDLQEKTLVELSSVEKISRPKKKLNLTFEVPGVKKVILDVASQKSIGIEVGFDITTMNPWKIVKKELLIDNIVVLQADSPFAPLKSDIDDYEEDDILMGYIFRDDSYSDEYYVCLTPEAKLHCESLADKIFKKQMKKLESTIYKTAKPWESLGSEREIDEFNVTTSRPLIKVQIKCVYPKPYEPKKFSDRDADDGYTEMVPERDKFENIFKRRLHCATQAIPLKTSSEVQTDLKFPRNFWTQCSVEDDAGVVAEIVQEISEENTQGIADGWKSALDAVGFNSILDIYNIDYPALKTNDRTFEEIEIMNLCEITYLKDARTHGKVVSSVAWLQTADLVAVSYADTVLGAVAEGAQTIDPLNHIYSSNLVLIWSLNDSLKPRLYLESDREVNTLSLAPSNANLLLGGCANGQIVIWDLTGKLDDPIPEILTDVQKKFRTTITPSSESIETNFEVRLLHVTAYSEHSKSHRDSVTDIVWLPNTCEMSKHGKINLLKENSESMQFFTTSLDCDILIWKLDRLAAKGGSKIPSNKVDVTEEELFLDISPYKILDNNFHPMYKLIIGKPEDKHKMPITSILFEPPEPVPIEKEDAVYSKEKIKEPPHVLWVTSLYGDVFQASWYAEDIDIENEKFYKRCDVSSKIKIHDGPVVGCVRSPFIKNIFATVGGKIFAIWSLALAKGPLMWKRHEYNITNFMWSNRVPSQIYLTTQNGNIDVWDFLQRSDKPTKNLTISGDILTGVYSGEESSGKWIVAVSDFCGSLRILRPSASLEKFDEVKLRYTQLFFDRESEAKQIFGDWEKTWYEKHYEAIETKRQQELTLRKEKERKLKVLAIREQERREIEAEKLREEQQKKTIGAEEKWKKMQWRYAIKLIQEKKRLNKSELKKHEKPLRELESQRIQIANKQCEALKKQQKIFEETISVLFPEALPTIPEPLPIIPIEEVDQKRKKVLDNFERVSIDARRQAEDDKFEYEFNWEKTIMKGKERRKALENPNAQS